jgi:hypothetical protein
MSAESFLVFSDVHLGSDLNDRGPKVLRSAAVDTDLAAMLAHYRSMPPRSGGRWHLVIAGDFIDFVGMSIDAPSGPGAEELSTQPNATERSFGLGGAEDHVQIKLKRAAARHWDVFVELGRFVGAGHRLTLVHGNHDIELHWDGVKRDFIELLARAAEVPKPHDIAARIDFCPWFFHREGLVFIEHGHQYDPFCATPYILAPLCPRDPTRVSPSLSDSLLRHIVRRTPGMKEYGHETRGLASYISWGLLLGVKGAAGLFRRFFGVVFELRRTAKAYSSAEAYAIRDEHERRLHAFARSTALPIEKLRSAIALHVAPIGRTPRGVLSSVMLDRLGVFCAVVLVLGVGAIFRGRLGVFALPGLAGVITGWGVLHVLLSRDRPDVDPATVMLERAARIGRIFSPSFVVMGHTHVPQTASVGDATYVNLGSWAEEEPDPEVDPAKAYRAARTHLVVHDLGTRHEASLREWRSGEGPHELEAFVRQAVPEDAGTTDSEVRLEPRLAAAGNAAADL